MRHIAVQRTSTVYWAIACPYCQYRNIKAPHILTALAELGVHIRGNHPRSVLQWSEMDRCREQLVLAFGEVTEVESE